MILTSFDVAIVMTMVLATFGLVIYLEVIPMMTNKKPADLAIVLGVGKPGASKGAPPPYPAEREEVAPPVEPEGDTGSPCANASFCPFYKKAGAEPEAAPVEAA